MVDACVLLVDDDSSLREALARQLRHEPYELLDAADAERALGILESRRVDVLVTDQQMPGMSGQDLLTLARERWPRTVRIMLTGNANLSTAMQAINEGEIHRFFAKPCQGFELLLGIRSALEVAQLKREGQRTLACLRRQGGLLEKLEREFPGVTRITRDRSGAIVIDPDDSPEDVCELIEQLRGELDRAEGNEDP